MSFSDFPCFWCGEKADLRIAIAENPQEVDWHNNLGLLYHSLGKYADAIDSFTCT